MVRERATAHAITAHGAGRRRCRDLIEADDLRFKQVVLNLLSNAVKFTPDGGSVSVHAYRDGTELAVTVTDTGIGVPPEDQERIFESFQQGRRGPSKEEGTGLGPDVDTRMVELMGGRMWLESTAGSRAARSASRSQACRSSWTRPPRMSSASFPRWSSSTTTGRRWISSRPTWMARRRESCGRRMAWRHSNWSGRCCLPLSCLTSGCRGSTAGRFWPSSRRTRLTAAIPVIIASVIDDRPRGLALGADVYLRKPVRREELLDALRSVGVSVDPNSGHSSSEAS